MLVYQLIMNFFVRKKYIYKLIDHYNNKKIKIKIGVINKIQINMNLKFVNIFSNSKI